MSWGPAEASKKSKSVLKDTTCSKNAPTYIFNLSKTKSATIILRGGAEQFIKEAERSLNDAIMIVRRCFKTNKVVAGGGATEMELSKGLK